MQSKRAEQEQQTLDLEELALGKSALGKSALEKIDLEALAIAAMEGDEFAADRLWEGGWQRLTRVALAFGTLPDDVPDLVQEVLLAAWKNLPLFDPAKGGFVSWLIPGLRGRIENRRRAARRRLTFLDRFKASWNRPHVAPAEGVEARVTLERLLNALTDRQRQVIALYEIEGMSARDAAQALGMSEAGVRSIARDARRRLKEEALGSAPRA